MQEVILPISKERGMKHFGWVVLLVLVLLSGCATAIGYDKSLKKYLNNHVDKMVLDWGPPHRVYMMANNNALYYYRKTSTKSYPGFSSPGTATTNFSGNTAYTTFQPGISSGDFTVNLICETQFIVSPRKIIVGYRFNGNGCKAYPPFR